MKVSWEQAARNHEKVIDTASRLFRTCGVEGVGNGELMRESGLTHGGFYNQFKSNEALATEACATSLAKSAKRWQSIVDQAEDGAAASAICSDYLNPRNRNSPETGCALITPGPDAAPRGGDLAAAFRDGFDASTDIFQQVEPALNRQTALARMGQIIGAMLLASGVADVALSDEIMAAARSALEVPA